MAMYKRKSKQTEFQSAVKKFLEHNRDPARRLKYLHNAEEKAADASEVKQLYEHYSSTIFFVFYSSFSSLELTILDRANKGKCYNEVNLKELRETVMPALERILIYLPELVHKKWQYNSLCLIMRKFLHPENVLKLRKDGIQLLILWLHALQDNAGDASTELFAAAVPHFPPEKTPLGLPLSHHSSVGRFPSLTLIDRYGMYSMTGSHLIDGSTPSLSAQRSSVSQGNRELVHVSVIHALHKVGFAGAADASDGLVTTQLIQHLMDCLTSQVRRLHWTDPGQHLRGFAFQFFLFKLFYLACLFKNYRTEAGLYTQPPIPDLNLPPTTQLSATSSTRTELPVLDEESSLDTISRSLSPATSSSVTFTRRRWGHSSYRVSQVIKLEYDLSHPIYNEVRALILYQVLSWLQTGKKFPLSSSKLAAAPSFPTTTPSPHPSLSSAFIPSGEELMREMWFTSRDNVNLLCEICRQCFLMSSEVILIRNGIDLFWSWIASPEPPLFMHTAPTVRQGLAEGTSLTTTLAPAASSSLSPSSLLPWEVIIHYEGYDMRDVRVGLQPALRMMIAHTYHVLLQRERDPGLTAHLQLSHRVIRLYQDIAVQVALDHDTWEYLLAVLLHLTLELLRGDPPKYRVSSLKGSMVSSLVKTLLVCFLRASMVTKVSGQLWDNLANVLSSLTHWKEIIVQWRLVMETMTQILSQTVYNLDLHDLPLSRLERRRGRVHTQTNPSVDLVTSHLSLFSAFEISLKRPLPMHGQKNKLSFGASTEEKKASPSLKKSFTVDSDVPSADNLLPIKTKRYSSIPCDNISSIPRSVVFTAGLKDRTTVQGSTSVDAIAKAINEHLVQRSTSLQSRRQYHLMDEGDSGLNTYTSPPPPPPPPTNSPVTDISNSSSEEIRTDASSKMAAKNAEPKSEETRAMDGSMAFVNPNFRSPSPDEQDVTSEHSVRVDEGRGGSVEPLLSTVEENDEGERGKRHVSKEGKEASTWFRRKLASTDAAETKGRKKGAGKSRAGQGLVFTNENSQVCTGEAGEREEGEKDMERSSLNVSCASLRGSKLSVYQYEERRGENAKKKNVRSMLKRKFSSEGMLNNMKVEDPDPPSQTVRGITSPLMMRRFRYDTSGEPTKVGLQPKEVSHHDFFTSSIIPSLGLAVVGSPVRSRSQSPAQLAMTPLSSPQLKPSSQLTLHRTAADEGVGGDVGKESPTMVALMQVPSLAEQIRSPSPSPTITIISPTSPPSAQLTEWTPVQTAVVWLRMLKILGDVNAIEEPGNHQHAFLTLIWLWHTLIEIDANLGISLDNQTTPPLPDFLPPLYVFAPWVVRACSLPQQYRQGRLIAVQMLCEMSVRHALMPPPPELLTHFYRLMHQALQPTSDTLNTAVKYGSTMFSHGLRGCFVLLTDCIAACGAVLGTKSKGSDIPRTESLCLLGSLLFLPELSPPSPPLPAVGGGEGEGVSGSQLREKLVDIIFTAARKEASKSARCLALHLVGIVAFSELHSSQPSWRLPEGIDILLASLTFCDWTLSMTAIDMLTLLTETTPQMLLLYPAMPSRVLEGLCYAIAVFLTDPDLEHSTWVNKVVVTLLLCLRDWVMALPVQEMIKEGDIFPRVLKEVFEVLQAAAGNSKQATARRHAIAQLSSIKTSVSMSIDPLDTGGMSGMPPSGTAWGHRASKKEDKGSEKHISSDSSRPLFGSSFVEDDRVQIAARSTLTHLLNLVGHFPFNCGPAQMTSVVCEHHDCPSLTHLDELSTEIFDSPRVQFFSFNDTTIVTLVEVPIEPAGLPAQVTAANYHSRIIVRDVSGKYTWDAAMLYGPQMPSFQLDGLRPFPTGDSDECISMTESVGLEVGGAATSGDPVPASVDPLHLQSWKSHINSDTDTLEDFLSHIEATSPECLLYPGVVGLTQPAPAPSKGSGALEEDVVKEVEGQNHAEQAYTLGAFTLSSMCGEKIMAPSHIHISSEFAYHHCRVLLGHLGMLSSSRRDHLDLLEKSNQLILDLKHLDSTQAQSRMPYKVAVLYVARGQEDKQSVLCNRRGSKAFEEFVSGLGWEVNMETHAGYMGGLKREFCANTTLPYYATSSEEVIFHVSTQMPSRGRDVEQKVRHLGNDEVHIVWSEHWRDYRRTIIKTQFADILIVIYPLPNRLFRIQIIKKPKQNIPQFGPLFDGALVNKESLSPLVRATAINALRAQRSPLVGYRGRYEERLKCIQNVVHRKLKSSYEEFMQNVMHPLESSSYPPATRVHTMNSPPVLEPLPPPQMRRTDRGAGPFALIREDADSATSTSLSSLHRIIRSAQVNRSRTFNNATGHTWTTTYRSRANTGEDHHSKSDLHRNQSVPEKLHQLHHTEDDYRSSQSRSVGLSASGTNLRSRARNSSPSPMTRQSTFSPNRSGTS